MVTMQKASLFAGRDRVMLSRHLSPTGMPLSEIDIARRVPVWTALAELFLDTQLEEFQYCYIADVLHDSGYSLHELQAIFHDEVAPVFHRNVNAAPGERRGWRDDVVKKMVLDYLKRRPTLAERLVPQQWLRHLRVAKVSERWEIVWNRLLP